MGNKELHRSAFFHVGKKSPPLPIQPDGSLNFEFYPFPSPHSDPDFPNKTYGDDNNPNKSFLMSLSDGDWAWFIVSASEPDPPKEMGYHVVYGFDVEARYFQKRNSPNWNGVPEDQLWRIGRNAHVKDGPWNKDWVILLGKERTSLDLFGNPRSNSRSNGKPLRISNSIEPVDWLRQAMLSDESEKKFRARWWQRKGLWGERVTRAVLNEIGKTDKEVQNYLTQN